MRHVPFSEQELPPVPDRFEDLIEVREDVEENGILRTMVSTRQNPNDVRKALNADDFSLKTILATGNVQLLREVKPIDPLMLDGVDYLEKGVEALSNVLNESNNG